jgi:hypothetical protein
LFAGAVGVTDGISSLLRSHAAAFYAEPPFRIALALGTCCAALRRAGSGACERAITLARMFSAMKRLDLASVLRAAFSMPSSGFERDLCLAVAAMWKSLYAGLHALISEPLPLDVWHLLCGFVIATSPHLAFFCDEDHFRVEGEPETLYLLRPSPEHFEESPQSRWWLLPETPPSPLAAFCAAADAFRGTDRYRGIRNAAGNSREESLFSMSLHLAGDICGGRTSAIRFQGFGTEHGVRIVVHRRTGLVFTQNAPFPLEEVELFPYAPELFLQTLDESDGLGEKKDIERRIAEAVCCDEDTVLRILPGNAPIGSPPYVRSLDESPFFEMVPPPWLELPHNRREDGANT